MNQLYTRVFSVMFFFISAACAQAHFEPKGKEVRNELILHNSPSRASLKTKKEYRALIWNIHKARKRGFDKELMQAGQDYDLLLLQETHLTPEFENLIESSKLRTHHFLTATAFVFKDHLTGVSLSLIHI